MQEYKVNDYITLRLEGKETNIYVKGKRFRQCKFLLLQIPIDKITDFDDIESIDEIAERLDRSLEPRANLHGQLIRNNELPPETEFWGHCSNMQVWYEHNYDTRLLRNNLAFLLLKKLTEVGDPLAKKVFKEEIARRVETGNAPILLYLMENGYLNYLNDYELMSIIYNFNNKIFDILEVIINKYYQYKVNNNIPFEKLIILEKIYLNSRELFNQIINVLLKRPNPIIVHYLASVGYLNLLKDNELIEILDGDFRLDELITRMLLETPARHLYEENGGVGALLTRIKRISQNYFKKKIIELYSSGNPLIFEYLNYLNLNNYILREQYYHYLLIPKEAEIMVELEDFFKIEFKVFGELGDSQGQITVKDKHVYGMIIRSEKKSFPIQILKLDSLNELYIYIPNLKISQNIIEKLKRIKIVEWEFKNIKN